MIKKLHQFGQRVCTILHQAQQPGNLKKFFRRKPFVVKITQITVFISAKIKAEEKTLKHFESFYALHTMLSFFSFTLLKKMFYVKLK